MVLGQKLDAEGERILFGVRILFDVIASPDAANQLPDALIAIETSAVETKSSQVYINAFEERKEPDISIVNVPLPSGELPSRNGVFEGSVLSTDGVEKAKEPMLDHDKKNTSMYQSNATDFSEKRRDIEEEIDHQMSLRREHVRRLRPLEIEQARKGIDTPPQVETQINDIRKKVVAIEERINSLNRELERLKVPDSGE